MKRSINQKKEITALLLLLLINTSVIGCSPRSPNKQELNKSVINISETASSESEQTTSSPNQISQGEKILITQDITPEKQAAAKAIANQDYTEAVSWLEQSLAVQPNDPEALIYLHNARIGEEKAYNLAVPVPIGTEITTAQEILRGVAQAQNEINQRGGINGTFLKIVIANDDNNLETVEKVAQNLVENQEILGVIGHFSSDASLAAAPIYQKKGLVAISATSTSTSLSEAGDYIFRTVPSDLSTSQALAKYAANQFQLDQAAIIYNSQSEYSKSQKEVFSVDLVKNGGVVVLEVDLATDNFNPVEVLQQAAREGATVLVFLNDSKTIDRAYLLMLKNSQLPMLAGNSIFKPQTLQIGGGKVKGMVLGVPWHISSSKNSDFLAGVNQLWGGEVGWRTAMAYDSTKALIVALGKASELSREGIQTTLSQPKFTFQGASGRVKFLTSGDRDGEVQLVKVQAGTSSSFGYDFVPLEFSSNR
ncbi:MAG: ABC transporter substrate-binding protein [Waterburya sp.]